MQARIKATGEEIIVEPYGDEFAQILPDGDYKVYTRQELSFPNDEIDWQQVRIQASIAALNGLTSNPSFEGHTLEDVVAECITIADALVAELKKGEGYADVQQ